MESDQTALPGYPVIVAGCILGFLLPAFAHAATAGEDSVRVQSAGPYLAMGVAALLEGALFTMAQTVIAAVGPFTVEQLEEEREADYAAAFVLRYRDRLPQIEVRFNVAALLMLLATCYFFTQTGIMLLPAMPYAGAGMGITIAMVLHLLLVEVVSRNIALSNPSRAVKLIVPVALLFALPLTPLLLLASLLMPNRRPPKHPAAIGDMHLRLLPSLTGVEGVLEEEAYDLIDSVREFAEMTAREIMTPRTEVEGVPDALGAAELYTRLHETEFSRVVVYRNSMDNIVGVLLVKEALLRRPADPYSLLREPIFVDEQTRLPELLSMIRRHRTHLIVLQDEFGGVSGIVTLHDLFETIVGHIEDIDDADELWIEELEDGAFRLNGRVEIWEVNEELGLSLDEDVARTIGGYVFHTLARVPEAGDVVELPGLRLEVEQALENRIEILKLVFTTSDSLPEAAER